MYKLLVLADGPCTPESFRPMDDARQWWARRDALTRIVYAQSQGQLFHDTAAESFSYLMFHNGNPASTEERGVNVMSVSNRHEAPISEFDLISAMKKASKGSSVSSKFVVQPAVSCRLLPIEEETALPPTTHSTQKLLGKFESLSKKEILAKLQSSCSMEFLRSHHLNASADAILKKRNIQQLQECWKAWDDSVADGQSRSNAAQSNSTDNDELQESNRLVAAYLAVFRDAKEEWRLHHGGKSDPMVTVLLLHEDYKYELPVFQATNSPTSADSASSEIIFCVMGAVRDMTAMESIALAQAVRQCGASLVVANLGRTAEFTSKIVMALRAHALHNNTLHSAVQELRGRQSLADQTELLNKLASSRANQSTWNGYETTTAVASSGSSAPIQATLTTIDEAVYPQCLVIAVSVPFPASSLSSTLDDRQRWLPYVRFIVFTMWKSRVVSDSTDPNQEKMDVQNVLHLVFACGLHLKIDQASITEEVTTNHCPAPSEYQILAMLQRLVAKEQSTSLSTVASQQQSQHHHTIIKGVLDNVGTMYADARHRPEIYTICFPTSAAAHEDSMNSLSEVVYSSPCWCHNGESSVTKEEMAVDIPRVLIVFVNVPVEIQSRDALSVLFESTLETMDSIPRKLRKRILAGIIGPVQLFPARASLQVPPSDAFRICALQHWAYHGRLFPSVASLKRNVEDVTCIHDTISSAMDDQKEKKKKRKKSHHSERHEADDEAVLKKKSKKA